VAWAAVAMVCRAARLAAGPLALAGFLLPWAHGPGVLSAVEFSGFDLVGYAGRLRQLDLAPEEGAALWAIRMAVLAVGVAAACHAFVAVADRRHAAYVLSGGYLLATAIVALIVAIARSGVTAPPAGLALWFAGAGLFALSEGATRLGGDPPDGGA